MLNESLLERFEDRWDFEDKMVGTLNDVYHFKAGDERLHVCEVLKITTHFEGLESVLKILKPLIKVVC